ncbi:hypothetical protein [Aquimarina algiphila]|uniref:Uncharacterized protein n=1 Tax=Aquimarina algiphila TaxID=2047982 RepID=A0A554VHX5_9FLAO|nr:hypothetical protein [Aquimarina algiphila]TSE07154.1 hypothetical protein FOF46_16670 [Aquimarina algiphila]
MKTLIIHLLITISITTISYAQNLNAELENTTYKVRSNKNVIPHFIKEVQNRNTPNHAKHFENLASQWGIQQVSKYDKPKKSFNATFKSDKGQIAVTYDKNGKLIAAEEEFKNIALPKHVIQFIYNKHRGWTVTGNIYSVSYHRNKLLKILYEVQLKKRYLNKSVQLNIDTIY